MSRSPEAHQMNQNKDPTYFTDGKYLNADMQKKISTRLKKSIPYPTLKRWRKQLKIFADADGLYTESDLDGLIGLGQWLQRGGKVKPYADRFIKHIDTIEV
jgi:hypothetical protein